MGGTVHVLITEPFDRELVSRLSTMSDRLAVHVHPARKAEEIPAILLTQTEVLYTLRALPEPSAAPALRWVHLHLAGMDRLTDHPLLKAGVQFTSLSGAAVSQMAEYAVMMMTGRLGKRCFTFCSSSCPDAPGMRISDTSTCGAPAAAM